MVRLDTGGPVIGLMEECVYQQASVTLAAGDVLVAYTDGISEAMNAADEEWGEERLMAAVRPHRRVPARMLIDRLMAVGRRVRRRRAAARRHDAPRRAGGNQMLDRYRESRGVRPTHGGVRR